MPSMMQPSLPLHMTLHAVTSLALLAHKFMEPSGLSGLIIIHAGQARRGPTLRECMLMHAIARLCLAGYINNIQVLP